MSDYSYFAGGGDGDIEIAPEQFAGFEPRRFEIWESRLGGGEEICGYADDIEFAQHIVSMIAKRYANGPYQSLTHRIVDTQRGNE